MSIDTVKPKMSVSEATSKLINLILQMPPKELIQTLNEIEEKYHNNKRDTRVSYKTEVVYAVNKKLHKGIISNINSNGIFIETSEHFEPGEQITLTFELPGSNEPIKVNGEIARTSSEGIGVHFDIDIEELISRGNSELPSPQPDLTT